MHIPAMSVIKAPVARLALTCGLLVGCGPVSTPAPAPGQSSVVASGFNGPQGVLVMPDGSLLVSEDGLGGSSTFTTPGQDGSPAPATYGDTARLTRVLPDGTQRVEAFMLSVSTASLGPEGGGKIAMIGDAVYINDGIWNASWSGVRPGKAASVLRLDGSDAVKVADLYAFEEKNNPDGVLAPAGIDSHSYGITAGPDGQLYVADAGANAVLKVNPAGGQISVAANLSGNLTGTGAQSVPTGVTFGPDGVMYVSLLSGLPLGPTASRVVRVVNGQASDFATGMSMLTDVQVGPDGKLYGVSFARADLTSATPFLPNSGTIYRLNADGSKVALFTNVNYPSDITFNAQGDAFVTEAANNRLTANSGQIVKYNLLTQYQPR